ncbi:hypothetical protein [Kineococcus sp. NPDC059986]|uniref:hypothetical protein n=1 Tax=Kineococcus sp. NPDC059986 TaxID=3155538 RepID=UPI00344BDFE6
MTPEEVLARHEGLVHLIARELSTTQWSMDDLAQEGRTALWLAAVERPDDNLDKLASKVIRSRILKVTSKGRGYGAELGEGEDRRFEPRSLFWTDGASEESKQVVEELMGHDQSAEDEFLAWEASMTSAMWHALNGPERVVARRRIAGETNREIGKALGTRPARVADMLKGMREKLERVLV